jgi:hypothetical protein
VTVISEGLIPYALEFSVPEAKWRPSIPEADAEGKVPLGLILKAGWDHRSLLQVLAS